MAGKLEDYEYPAEQVKAALAGLPKVEGSGHSTGGPHRGAPSQAGREAERVAGGARAGPPGRVIYLPCRCSGPGRTMIPPEGGAGGVQAAVARFVDAEVAPVADALDQAGEFPREVFRRLGQQGYFGLRYPEAYGGAEADFVTFCLFAEELARGSMSLAALAAMQSLMGTLTRSWSTGRGTPPAVPGPGPPRREDRHLRADRAEGRVGHGNLPTLAERVDGGWRLKGVKTWVTNAPVADMLTVGAKTSPGGE